MRAFQVQEERKAEGKCMPEILYLQLDNVYSNKSKTMMKYATWLVDTGVFKKVKVCFLLVGHTHENIDQMFSRLSVKLRKSDIFYGEDLVEAARTCFTPSPMATWITHAFDWKTFFVSSQSYLDIQDLSFNHNFKVTCIIF